MKQGKDKKEVPKYRSVKILERHYEIALKNKILFGTPMSFFIGDAIEKLQSQKPK